MSNDTKGGTPVPRSSAVAWANSTDALFIFGGLGSSNILGDLWMRWTLRDPWIELRERRASSANPLSDETPGARWGAAGWSDASDHLWLFAGQRNQPVPKNADWPNDLWAYSAADNVWIQKESGAAIETGTDRPMSRILAATCYLNNALWLFGGLAPVTPYAERLNDLWAFDCLSEKWRRFEPRINEPWPTAREGAVLFGDTAGNLHLFGGNAHDVTNERWVFETTRQTWICVEGLRIETFAQIEDYRVTATQQSDTYPTPRSSPALWTDADGNAWLFGGSGLHAGEVCMLNDLWLCRTSSAEAPVRNDPRTTR